MGKVFDLIFILVFQPNALFRLKTFDIQNVKQWSTSNTPFFGNESVLWGRRGKNRSGEGLSGLVGREGRVLLET